MIKYYSILQAYFSVGLVMSFVSTPLNVYLVEQLDAEPKMQTTMSILQTLPWSLKLIFGFLSDAVPIFGMHRKPYLAIGAMVYSGSFLLYAFSNTEDVFFLACCIFFGTLGLITMDVMCDTMVILATGLFFSKFCDVTPLLELNFRSVCRTISLRAGCHQGTDAGHLLHSPIRRRHPGIDGRRAAVQQGLMGMGPDLSSDCLHQRYDPHLSSGPHSVLVSQ